MSVAVTPKASASDFSALDACHQQIAEHLERLDALMNHLEADGVDPHAQREANAIEAFFSGTSRQHHAEEELKVFPLLLASSDTALVATVQMLKQDHGWIEEDWHEIAPQLEAIARGYSWYDPAELRHALQVFLELCREHIALEESLIYPEAKAKAASLRRRRASLAAPLFTRAAPSSS